MKLQYRFAIALGLLNLVGSIAFAASSRSEISCADVLSDYHSSISSSVPSSSSSAYFVEYYPECFAGPQVSTPIITGTSGATALAISNGLASRSSGGRGPRVTSKEGPTWIKGMAAGDTATQWSAWGNAVGNITDQNVGTVNTDINVYNGVLGVDYAVMPKATVGVALTLDSGDGESGVNSFDTSGFMLAPYVAWQLTPELSVDGSIGIGQGEYEATGNVKSDSDRWFAAANLSYDHWADNIQVTGKLSFLHGVENRDDLKLNGITQASTSQDNTIDQMRMGLRAGYWLGGSTVSFMPYVSLGYATDARKARADGAVVADPIGLSAWTWGLGVDVFSLGNNLTGGLAYNREENRRNQENYSINANVNFRF